MDNACCFVYEVDDAEPSPAVDEPTRRECVIDFAIESQDVAMWVYIDVDEFFGARRNNVCFLCIRHIIST